MRVERRERSESFFPRCPLKQRGKDDKKRLKVRDKMIAARVTKVPEQLNRKAQVAIANATSIAPMANRSWNAANNHTGLVSRGFSFVIVPLC